MYGRFFSTKLANPTIMRRLVTNFATDFEGNLKYAQLWAQRSQSIQFKDGVFSFKPSTLGTFQKFVYGGDFADKGPGDLRIGNALTAFKKSNPDNVLLLAGNREIKCRRFTYELEKDTIRKRLLIGQPAFWRKQVSPKDFVIQQMKQEKLLATSDADIEKYVNKMSPEQCQSLYLKWMLNETMGCGPFKGKPSTFEFRRLELAEMGHKSPQSISDEDVTQSFIASVATDGVMTQYLKQAQLGVVIGDTLFLHGAATRENIGYVPGVKERIPNAKEWIDALNTWYKEQISSWDKQRIDPDFQPPGHEALDEYVLFNPKSVVTTNWYQNGKLDPIPKEVVDYLNQAGIHRVVTGHQPFSDFPLIIRSPSLEIIVGDTGYSDPDAPDNNRGQAIHNLEIVGEGRNSHVSIDARRKDGTPLKLELPSRQEVHNDRDIEIGHFTEDGRLIRPGTEGALVGSVLSGFEVIDEPLSVPTKLMGLE